MQSPNATPTRRINFDYAGYAGQGVPVRELASRAIPALMQMIANPGDSVGTLMPGVKTGTVTFKICVSVSRFSFNCGVRV